MRGVELGISLEEFRALAIPQDDESSYDLHVRCTDQFPAGGLGPGPSLGRYWRYPVNEAGVVNCGWFDRKKFLSPTWVSELFVTLGAGKGPPQFQFVEQAGRQRLFRISVKANAEYYPGIPDALTRAYGEPAKSVETFQVRSGATFPATTLTWRNALSTISIVDHCEHLERYCLTYEDTELKRLYDALLDRRDAAAASKI